MLVLLFDIMEFGIVGVLTDKKRTTKSIRNCVYFPFFIDYLLNLPQYHHSISFQFAAVLFGDTDKQTVFQSK